MRTRRRFGMSGIVLLVLVCAHARAGAADTVFMWKATGEKGTAYLLGSAHVGKNDLYPLDTAVTDAYETADAVVAEIDILGQNPIELAQKTMALGMYREGTLEDHVSAETVNLFRAWCRKSSMPFNAVQSFKPWFAAAWVSQMEMSKHGYDPQNGIDMHFLRRAKDDGKPVLELESVDLQLGIFDSMSAEAQEAWLLETLREVDTIEALVAKTFRAWERGDARMMQAVIELGMGEKKGFETLHEELFDKRNIRMAERVVEFLEDGDVLFVVVGAGHLVGKTGLPTLLEKKGFDVTQVEAKGKPAPVPQDPEPEAAVVAE